MNAIPVTSLSPREILKGLAPSLIVELSAYGASGLEGLEVHINAMSFGNRATLHAYGLIEVGESPLLSGRRMVLSVNEYIQDVIALAVAAVHSVARSHLFEVASYFTESEPVKQ